MICYKKCGEDFVGHNEEKHGDVYINKVNFKRYGFAYFYFDVIVDGKCVGGWYNKTDAIKFGENYIKELCLEK